MKALLIQSLQNSKITFESGKYRENDLWIKSGKMFAYVFENRALIGECGCEFFMLDETSDVQEALKLLTK
jgi:hypothetical protein